MHYQVKTGTHAHTHAHTHRSFITSTTSYSVRVMASILFQHSCLLCERGLLLLPPTHTHTPQHRSDVETRASHRKSKKPACNALDSHENPRVFHCFSFICFSSSNPPSPVVSLRTASRAQKVIHKHLALNEVSKQQTRSHQSLGSPDPRPQPTPAASPSHYSSTRHQSAARQSPPLPLSLCQPERQGIARRWLLPS